MGALTETAPGAAIAMDPDRVLALGNVKRFLEWWAADPAFREELGVDPRQAAARRGLPVDPLEIRPLWDGTGPGTSPGSGEDDSPLTAAYCEFRREKMDFLLRVRRESAPREPRFRAWRERQIARSRTQFPARIRRGLPHPPFACELTRGCSVGCWFCGVGARGLDGVFRRTPDNARLWRQCLTALGDLAGPEAGRWGFCYWATDPLDNPDYEALCCDFHDVFGLFPQTTTAQPLKDSGRIRRLLELSQSRGCFINRFSILSLSQLARLHQEYRPEELTFVELVLLNSGSIIDKVGVGRKRERDRSRAEREGRPFEEQSGQTIACVSGFLLNMVERSVKLISPCPADDRWPLGYVVFDEGGFVDADDLRAVVERMIDAHMPTTVARDRRVRFRRDLVPAGLGDGFQLSGPFGRHTFTGNPFLAELGALVEAGERTAEEIARSFMDRYGVEPCITFDWLNLLLDNGVLDEEPSRSALLASGTVAADSVVIGREAPP